MTKRYFYRLVVILVVCLFTQHANAQREPKDGLGERSQTGMSLKQKKSGGQDAAASAIVRQYSGRCSGWKRTAMDCMTNKG